MYKKYILYITLEPWMVKNNFIQETNQFMKLV